MDVDEYQQQAQALLAYGDEWEAITPADGSDLPRMYRYILNVAATAGTVGCVSRNGTTTTIAVGAGDVLKVRPVRIRAAGTATVTLIGVL